MIKYELGFAGLKKEFVAKAINRIITDSWGDFGIDYIKSHIIKADYLALATHEDDVIGFASANKFLVDGKPIYYLEFTAVAPGFQDKKISKALNKLIFKQLFLENILKFRLSFEVIAITPNPRILGAILRTAGNVYPSPKRDPRVPQDVWRKMVSVVDQIGDPYKKLEQVGAVIEGFYDGSPHLIYDQVSYPRDPDHSVNDFSEKHLRFSEKLGREFVVYARYTIWDLFKTSGKY